MIPKKFRLKEREIKKVFHQKKPFFSSLFIANVRPNQFGANRFAILLGSKSIHGSVERNFFRRTFYQETLPFLTQQGSFDVLFVPKKKVVFCKQDSANVAEFTREIRYLLKKITTSI